MLQLSFLTVSYCKRNEIKLRMPNDVKNLTRETLRQLQTVAEKKVAKFLKKAGVETAGIDQAKMNIAIDKVADMIDTEVKNSVNFATIFKNAIKSNSFVKLHPDVIKKAMFAVKEKFAQRLLDNKVISKVAKTGRM